MSLAELGAVIGVLGFALSCVNLWRGIQSTKETRSIAFAQKKQEALSLVIDGEVANMAARRQLWEVRDDAFEIDADDLVEEAEKFIKDYDQSIARLADARLALEAQAAGQMNHDDHVRFIEATIGKLKQITDPKKIAEEVAVFVDPAKRNIALRKKLKERELGDDKKGV